MNNDKKPVLNYEFLCFTDFQQLLVDQWWFCIKMITCLSRVFNHVHFSLFSLIKFNYGRKIGRVWKEHEFHVSPTNGNNWSINRHEIEITIIILSRVYQSRVPTALLLHFYLSKNLSLIGVGKRNISYKYSNNDNSS